MEIEILKRRLALYLECEAAILRGAEYQIGDRRLRRADLSEVRKAIDDLESRIAQAGGRVRRIARVIL